MVTSIFDVVFVIAIMIRFGDSFHLSNLNPVTSIGSERVRTQWIGKPSSNLVIREISEIGKQFERGAALSLDLSAI